jgi:hypothetical protein
LNFAFVHHNNLPMKKFLSLLLLVAVIAGSCTKEYVKPSGGSGNTNTGGGSGSGGSGGSGGGGGGGLPTIGPVPDHFTQKVLIEEFTGEWCGYCPDGALLLESAQDAHPTTVYGASVHEGDPYQTASTGTFTSTFGIGSYPSGMVNRVAQGGSPALDRNYWSGAAASQLGQTAVCGLAMQSYYAGTDSLYIEVHCGFLSPLSGDYRVTIYLIENGIVSNGQQNYYNTPGSVTPDNPALNNIGDPIQNWTHNDVLRKVVTADMGDVIPASALITGGEYVKKYGTTVTGFNKSNIRILAFINFVGSDAATHQILNVQQASVGEIKVWD